VSCDAPKPDRLRSMPIPVTRLLRQRHPIDATPGEAAVPPPTGPPAAGRIAVIDGLRLVAALAVVAYHYLAYDRGDPKPWGVPAAQAFPAVHLPASYGWLGVDLFFVISGFVICLSAWGRTPGAFLRSRVTRLFPAYWAAVLITFTVVSLWPVVRGPVSVSAMLVNLTMLQEPLGVRPVDPVYWTLWAEARFYLLFAVLVWHGLTIRRVIVFGYGWLIAAVLAVRAEVPLLDTIVQPAYAPYFVAGIAFFLIHRFGSHLVLWGLVAVSFALAQHHAIAAVAHVVGVLHRPLPVAPAQAAIAGIFTIMAVVALGWLNRVRWRWLTVTGVLTYPLYLVHQYIGWTLIAFLHDHLPRAATLALVVTAMLVAAWLLHRLVERPLARQLRHGLGRPVDRAGPTGPGGAGRADQPELLRTAAQAGA
jgi:peptidoglycan/LPS O-acetylase OafA/YrhL